MTQIGSALRVGTLMLFVVSASARAQLAADASAAELIREVRSQIEAGIFLAARARFAVTDYYVDSGASPSSRADAGLSPDPADTQNQFVSSVDVVNGSVIITFGNDAHEVINGETLGHTPYESNDLESVLWNCGAASPPQNASLLGTASGISVAEETDGSLSEGGLEQYLPPICSSVPDEPALSTQPEPSTGPSTSLSPTDMIYALSAPALLEKQLAPTDLREAHAARLLDLYLEFCHQKGGMQEVIQLASESSQLHLVDDPDFENLYETEFQGVSYGIFPEEDRCTIDAKLEQEPGVLILSPGDIHYQTILETRYALEGLYQTTEEQDGDSFIIYLPSYTSSSPEAGRIEMRYPMSYQDTWYMNLTYFWR